MKHALLSPSSAHRWIVCPGSLAMSRGEPNPRSKYSDEGTAAHFLASTVLDSRVKNAADYIGRTIVVWSHPESESEGTDWSEDLAASAIELECSPFEIDEAMAGHVQTYVDAVRLYSNDGTLLVEQSLSIAHITGEDDARGTSDAVVIVGDELQVHDLKYGMGIQVDATNNPQLKIYALAALEEFSFLTEFKRVRFVIHQPRLDHVSEWDCSTEELVKWGEEKVRASATTALMAYHGTLDTGETLYLRAGDHCKTAFCPARSKCPVLAAYVAESVGADFENLDEIKAAVAEVKAEVSSIDLPTLGKKLSAVDLIEDWCTAVRARVEGVLLEHGNAEAVRNALGFKLVQGRKGARSWKSETEAEAVLKALRLKADQMYNRKLISPTQCEEALKATPKKWEKVIPIVVQRDGKPSVAALGDKRPALVITPVIESFEDLEGKDLV